MAAFFILTLFTLAGPTAIAFRHVIQGQTALQLANDGLRNVNLTFEVNTSETDKLMQSIKAATPNPARTPDPEEDDENEAWDPLERRFGAGVSAIFAQWSTKRHNNLPWHAGGDDARDGPEVFEGPLVMVNFPIGKYKDLKAPREGECLRKCKVKTETSGFMGASCNGGLNWKKLQPWRKEKHAVSMAAHSPRAGGRAMPWVDRYTLCCEIVECEPESWKINYDFYSPMPMYNDKMDRFKNMCLCCTEALEKDNEGFHHLSKVANSCRVAFSLRSAVGDVNGLGGYIPDSDVVMRVANSVWEPRCNQFCEADETHKFGYPKTKLAIANWK